MNHHDFKHHFQSVVEVMFDWRAFLCSDWPIQLRYFSLPEQSSHIYTPWYALADGSACNYDSANAKPQSVAAVASNIALRTHHNVRENPSHQSTSVVPAYRLDHETILLLDGNHRTVAAQVSGSRMALAAFVVCGPIDQGILPDLRHWTQQAVPADRPKAGSG